MTTVTMLAVLDCSRCDREMLVSLDEDPTADAVFVTCQHCGHTGRVDVDYIYDPGASAAETAA